MLFLQLIQFMIHLVGGNSNTPLQNLTKRKMPLMLNDANQVMAAKRPRYGNQISIEELTDVINTVCAIFIKGNLLFLQYIKC